jgi:predicted NBD/HSP70 family sugar kinase
MESFRREVGIFLSILINFVNPDTIALCGGLSRAEKYFMGQSSKKIKVRAFKTAAKICKIIISKYTRKLGVVGVAMLSKQ